MIVHRLLQSPVPEGRLSPFPTDCGCRHMLVVSFRFAERAPLSYLETASTFWKEADEG